MDVGGRAMPGAIAEKTPWSSERYSHTWMARHFLQQLDCYRIAEPRQAHQWAYLSEGMDPSIALTCHSQFGSGWAFFRLGFGIGVK